jgi:ADP-heptose:LPS heptosyltransferase
MQKNVHDILVIRNDKIGDFILILPALSWIKKNIPNCNITCIVSKNVSDIAKQCKLIDNVIIDKKISKLSKELNKYKFDASVSFFSTFRIGYLVKHLNIPIRIAPKTKLAQIFYNYKISQKRSNSNKPEYEYNSDLVYELFKILNIDEIKDMDDGPYLDYKNDSIEKRKEIFIKEYNLKKDKKIIFIHPATGGSSKSLDIQSFSDICKGLRKFDDYNFIVHCSPEDEQHARNLKVSTGDKLTIRVIETKKDVIHMLENISLCDVFIAGSTGPLHIAGAFNKKTVGFYPKKKSSTSLRWETINSFDKKLSFTDIGKSKNHISIEINKTILQIQKFI